MSTAATQLAAPVAQSERIDILDALRGIAILGILLMNIPSFGLPSAVGHDPTLWNEIGTINFKVLYFVDLVPEGTQRAIFSMLFGAGILIFTSRAEKKLPGIWPADYFLRRQLWLMVFGLFDIWVLLWFGDILFDYACLGILVFTFRRLPVKGLLIGAGICFLLMIGRETRDLYKDKAMIAKGEKIALIDTTKTKLTEQQKEDLGAMTDFKERSTREKKLKRVEKSIRKTTGSYADAYEYRGEIYMGFLVNYLYLSSWDVLLFMFLGMAFFKTGVLTGQAAAKTYWIMTILGLGIGLTLSYLRFRSFVTANFNWFELTKNQYFDLYTVSRVARSLGLLGLILLLYKSGWVKWLFALMRPVGQMAFTNYLTQSLLCGLFFYGVGFGMYGKLQRVEVYYFVLAVWLVQIIWSHLWLRYFNFGPFEWLWRSLTYWKKQPMRKPKNI
ncbi:MAG: DUF418 domain-containing protein [Niastella sp.]|nr:DUF418 domain-containing protein [Niastella sp.]